jgi:protein-L-isoaspartate O-methyltransferase
VPRFYRYTGEGRLVFDSADPERYDDWLHEVYRDVVLNVLWDEQHPLVNSTSSMPSKMAQMLEALDGDAGHRVLEIGTGTGYNAALLCERLGSDRVTTVDIDAGLVEAARERLATAGYSPTVAAADGFHGHPGNAPYDRVIATCQTRDVPAAWIDQCRPGGLVLAMLPCAMARLRVTADGSAEGRFHPASFGFMSMRALAVATPGGRADRLAEPAGGEPARRLRAVGGGGPLLALLALREAGAAAV